MAHIPRYDENDLPRSERLTNNPDIPPITCRERPPQFNGQACGCHCHTGNGCYCAEAVADPNNSNSNGRGDGTFSSEVDALNHGMIGMGLSDDHYDSDSDIELDSESSSSSSAPYQFYGFRSLEYEGMMEPPEHVYDFLDNFDVAMHPVHVVDGSPDNLDEPFVSPVRAFVSPRRGSPAPSMEVNCGSGEISMRSSSIRSSAMIRSGTPSHYTRFAGYTFQEPAPQSRFLELTPPLSTS